MIYANDHFDDIMPITEKKVFPTMMHMKHNFLETWYRIHVQAFLVQQPINTIDFTFIDNMYSSKSDTQFHYPISKSSYPSASRLSNFEMG